MGLARKLLGTGAIARCEGSWALSAAGAWIFAIALALYAYYEHGPAGVGLAIGVRMLPTAALAGLPALLARRLSRSETVAVSALGRFLALEAIALVVWLDAPFALLLVLAAVVEVGGGLHRSMRRDLRLEHAPGPEHPAAVSRARVVSAVGFLAGAVVAAVLLSTVSFQATFAVAGLLFVVAALVTWRLSANHPARVRLPPPAPQPRPWPALRPAVQQPAARLRVSLFGATVLVQAMLDLVLVVVAVELVHLGDGGVGWLRAAFAAGGLGVAVMAVSWLAERRLAGETVIGLVLAGLPLVLIVAWPALAPTVILIGLVGAGYALAEGALGVLTERLVPHAQAAHVASLERHLYPLARAVGGGVGAWLFLGLGDQTAVVVSGLLLPAIALVAARPVMRAERALTAGPGADAVEFLEPPAVDLDVTVV